MNLVWGHFSKMKYGEKEEREQVKRGKRKSEQREKKVNKERKSEQRERKQESKEKEEEVMYLKEIFITQEWE